MTASSEVPFTSLLTSIVDNRGRTAPTADSGIPLIATSCIKDDALYPVFEKVRYVSSETYGNWFRDHPEPGDILFVCKGSPGRVALVPDPVSFCIAQDMVAVRADRSRVYPPYLFAVLRSDLVRRRIDNMHVGTLIPHFKKGDFGRLMIPLASDSEQRYIGDLYRDFSLKIESNRRLVALMLGLIRAWTTDALASCERQTAVAELASFVNGGAYTKGASGVGRLVIRIAELNSGPGASTVYSDIDVPDEKTARPGDILMSWSGSLGVYRWFRDEAIVNQHIFKVLPKDGFPNWLVFDRLDAVMPIFQGIAKDKATTMGHIQRGHLESTLVALPSKDSLAELDRRLAPLWKRLLLAERENVHLAGLRDALLSELLAARVHVPEVAEPTEAVA
jgi:type I restriction enzyme S subunit